MMPSLQVVFAVLAAVCFVVALSIESAKTWQKLIAAGLALWMASQLWP